MPTILFVTMLVALCFMTDIHKKSLVTPEPEPVDTVVNPFFVDRCSQMEDEMEEMAERIEMIHRVSTGIDQLNEKADKLQKQTERMTGVMTDLQSRVYKVERLAVEEELEGFLRRENMYKVHPEAWRREKMKNRRNY